MDMHSPEERKNEVQVLTQELPCEDSSLTFTLGKE